MPKSLLTCAILIFAFNTRLYCQDDKIYKIADSTAIAGLNDTSSSHLDTKYFILFDSSGKVVKYQYSDSELPDPFLGQARLLISQANYDSALKILNNYINHDSLNNEAWYLLGLTFDQKENLPKAMKYYHISIALDSTYWRPYQNLAYLFDIFSQNDSMNYYMRQAVELTPHPESLYFDLAYSYDVLNQSDSALAYYHKYNETYPNDVDSYLDIGAIWGERNNIDSARAYTLKALELNPNYPRSCYNYAEILRLDGNSPGAIDYYQKALALDTTMVEVKLCLGELYESLGDSSMAKEYYQEFVNSAPPLYYDDINRVKARLENYR